METNSIVKSFMIEKILKIDFQNFYISWNVSKSISWTFLGSLHNETNYREIRISWKSLKEIFHSVSSPSYCFIIILTFQKRYFQIALRHGSSPVNLLHIFRTPFLKNISGWLLLYFVLSWIIVQHPWT